MREVKHSAKALNTSSSWKVNTNPLCESVYTSQQCVIYRGAIFRGRTLSLKGMGSVEENLHYPHQVPQQES